LLRLWTGCLEAAAKAIRFNYVAGIKDGVEAAPAYKKLLKQRYSFSGVPSNSIIRRYSNEYNKDDVLNGKSSNRSNYKFFIIDASQSLPVLDNIACAGAHSLCV
jgi:hypothetical protein